MPVHTRWSGASRSIATADRLPPLVVLAGATATGKTRLALDLAEHLGRAEIISADSRQVYRGMDIGTAKVGPAERGRVPHHGLDLVDPDGSFTVADFRQHALIALAGIASRGRIAILAGGTGLYLRVVARGIPLDDAGHDPAIRADLEARLTADGLDALTLELWRVAPGLAARTDLANPRRVVRTLERALIVGDRPPPAPGGYPGPVAWMGVQLDRAEHERIIVMRARDQFARGLTEEAVALRARYGDGPRAFSAMGYREALALADGHCDEATAIAEVANRTIAYARRQATWFRSEPEIIWLPAGGADRLTAAVRVLERSAGLLRPPPSPDAVS